MNKEALEYWFEKEGIYCIPEGDSFALFAGELSNKTIREIGACNGKLILKEDFCLVVDKDE